MWIISSLVRVPEIALSTSSCSFLTFMYFTHKFVQNGAQLEPLKDPMHIFGVLVCPAPSYLLFCSTNSRWPELFKFSLPSFIGLLNIVEVSLNTAPQESTPWVKEFVRFPYFVFHLLRISILWYLLATAWKQMFHLFCLVLYLFSVRE